MSDSSLADLYAGALLRDTEKVFCEQLEWITSIFHRHPELLDILSLQEIPLEEKKKNLEDVFKGKIDPQVFNLLILLSSNGRLHLLDSIYQELLSRVTNSNFIQTGKIISAFPLDEETIRKIETRFSNASNTPIRFSVEVDPALIGGVAVIVGDKVFDGSIRSRLRKMKEYILNS